MHGHQGPHSRGCEGGLRGTEDESSGGLTPKHIGGQNKTKQTTQTKATNITEGSKRVLANEKGGERGGGGGGRGIVEGLTSCTGAVTEPGHVKVTNS